MKLKGFDKFIIDAQHTILIAFILTLANSADAPRIPIGLASGHTGGSTYFCYFRISQKVILKGFKTIDVSRVTNAGSVEDQGAFNVHAQVAVAHKAKLTVNRKRPYDQGDGSNKLEDHKAFSQIASSGRGLKPAL